MELKLCYEELNNFHLRYHPMHKQQSDFDTNGFLKNGKKGGENR